MCQYENRVVEGVRAGPQEWIIRCECIGLRRMHDKAQTNSTNGRCARGRSKNELKIVFSASHNMKF